jgi:hypothetical protein
MLFFVGESYFFNGVISFISYDIFCLLFIKSRKGLDMFPLISTFLFLYFLISSIILVTLLRLPLFSSVFSGDLSSLATG